ncbi:MAG: nucleotidyltransferase family protein [Candidatus Saccharibacteria bacterium]
MNIKTEEDIRQLIKSDQWMMQVLKYAEKLNLPDWWIGAGFLRNKVWNAVEGDSSPSNTDVDLVYFNSSDVKPETDWAYDKKMNDNYPIADWEIRNQARMHYVNKFEPFTSTENGISNWVETATCSAVKLENGKLKLLFCYGIDDLINLTARPTPRFRTPELINVFHDHVKNKNWKNKWPHLKVKFK